MLILGLPVPHLSPSDFSPDQRAGWIAASERKAATEAALAPDAGHTNDGSDREWFVAYTDPKREDGVARELRRRQLATFYPAMTVSRVQGRRRVTVSAPLLPRYLFVGLGLGQSLYALRQTPGLDGMVRVGGVPATVSDALIQGLREAQAAGVYDFSDATAAERDAARRAEAAKAFEPGRVVRIVAGPFASFSGVVEGPLPDGRVAVIVSLFGRSSPVPMMLADIEAA